MSEQRLDVLVGNRIETHQTPLVLEGLRTQIRNSSIFKNNKPIDQEVAAAREKIKKEPFFLFHSYSTVSKEGFQTVPLNRVVGGVSLSFHHWGDEYHQRRGRHQEIISGLIEAVKKEEDEPFHQAVNQVFHLDDRRATQRIDLVKIEGPVGEVYFISDGTHRVSACKALELEFIPSQVEVGQIKEVYSMQEKDKIWWEELAKAGLIKGEINEGEIQIGANSTAEMYWLEVEEAVVPWVNYSYQKFFRFNQKYNEIYPEAFKNLKDLSGNSLPEEIFLDFVEFERFLKEN